MNTKKSFEVSCPFTGEHNLELRPTDESSKIHPSSYYGITKQVQEQMIIMATKLKNINGYALRYQNVFGPGQSLKNPYTGILSIFCRLALHNEEINVFEDGNESRDFVFIDDVVEAWKLCLKKNKTNQIFNIASGKATKFSTIINNLIKIIKPDQNVRVIQKGITYGDLKGSLADINKTKKHLNFTAKIKLENGLLRMWQNENKK